MTDLEKFLNTALISSNKRIEKLKQDYDTKVEMLINCYRCGNSERFSLLLNEIFKEHTNLHDREDVIVNIGIIDESSK